MKKIVALVLVAVMMFAFVSCGSKGTDTYVLGEDGMEITIKASYSKDVLTKLDCEVVTEVTEELAGVIELFGEDAIIEQISGGLEYLDDYDFCEFEYDITDEAITISVVLDELDDLDHLEELGDLDMFGIDDVDGELISYKEFSESLLDDDYEKQ